MTHPLLPDLPGFSIEQVTVVDEVILVLAHSQRERPSRNFDANPTNVPDNSRFFTTSLHSGNGGRREVFVFLFFCE
jgi:hypothetical protein